MTPLNQRLARPGRLVIPLFAGVLVALLLGAAVITAGLTALARGDGSAADGPVSGLPAAATSAAVLGAGSCVTSAPFTPRQLREPAYQPVIAATTLDAAQPARRRLRALAGAVAASACDRAAGAYVYVQFREWVIAGTAATGASVRQYEHWLAADGSGRSSGITIRVPADENPLTDEMFPPGAGPVDPAPPAADAGILAAPLNSFDASAPGPQSRLRALAGVNQWKAPERDVSAASIAALRPSDRHTCHTCHGVSDRAGRPGHAIAAVGDDSGSRDLILPDPRAGELLASVAHPHTASVRQR
jgi:hypothetical protein